MAGHSNNVNNSLLTVAEHKHGCDFCLATSGVQVGENAVRTG